jgi:riboflavin transporter FmnP
MLEYIERAFVLGTAGWFLLIALGLCSYTLISQMLDDHLQAIIGTPILMQGAALCHQILKEQGFALSSDKVVGMGIGFMIGLIATAVLLASAALLVNTIRGR